MRIGELPTHAGVSVRALHHYGELTLSSAQRAPSSRRHRPGRAEQKVRAIQQLYAAVLSGRRACA